MYKRDFLSSHCRKLPVSQRLICDQAERQVVSSWRKVFDFSLQKNSIAVEFSGASATAKHLICFFSFSWIWYAYKITAEVHCCVDVQLIRNYFVSFVSWVFPEQLFLALFLAFVTRWRLAYSAVHGTWEKFRFDRNSYSMILCCIIKQDQQTTAALLAAPLMTHDPRILKLSDSGV